MKGTKKGCKYKRYRHPLKYFSVFFFLWLLFCIVNYTSLVVYLNPQEYQQTQGTVIEHGDSVLFGILPRTKWRYYDELHLAHELNVTMWQTYLFSDDYSENITIYYNKKVPDDAMPYFRVWRSPFNYIVWALSIFCIWQILLGVIINTKIRIYRKQQRKELKDEKNARKYRHKVLLEHKRALALENKVKALPEKDGGE